MEYPQRKRNRLAGYDYSAPGAYFVTICTYKKRCNLSRIAVGEGLAPPAVRLTPIGTIVEDQLRNLPARYPSLVVNAYAIMPNHVHLLLTLYVTQYTGGASPAPTVPDIVCTFKSLIARQARADLDAAPLWQRSFHDHVIRNDADFRATWDYIGNPARWAEDCFYQA